MTKDVIKESPTAYCESTKKLRSALESGFIELGKRLLNIRDNKLYEGRWNNFEEFVQECGLSEATASRLITVYTKFVLDFGMKADDISSIGWSVLYQIGKSVESKEEAKEFVEKALVSRRSDIEDELREKKHGKDCKHKWTEIHLKVCEHCGKREKIYV